MTEELLALMPLVVSLPARLAVEPGLFFVTRMAPERPLLHTTFGTVEILVASALLAAFEEGLFRANTSRSSISHPRVFLSCEAEVELPDRFVAIMAFTAFSYGTQDIGSAEL